MADVQALSAVTTSATALGNLILVSPQKTIGYQPQNAPNPDGSPSTATPAPALLFHYEGENVVNIKSDITDHWVEDNTAIQDQIALLPERVSTEGFIGELNDITPSILVPLKVIADKLTTITSYIPAISVTALEAYNEALLLYQTATNVANSAVSAWNSLNGTGGESTIINGQLTSQSNQNKQQTYFQQFYGYWQSRTLFTVQTPWAVFQNMAIESIDAIQDATTNVISSFKCTFKMIRFASSQTVDGAIEQSYQGRSAAQSAGETDLGPSAPVSSISLEQGLSNGYSGVFPGVA